MGCELREAAPARARAASTSPARFTPQQEAKSFGVKPSTASSPAPQATVLLPTHSETGILANWNPRRSSPAFPPARFTPQQEAKSFGVKPSTASSPAPQATVPLPTHSETEILAAPRHFPQPGSPHSKRQRTARSAPPVRPAPDIGPVLADVRNRPQGDGKRAELQLGVPPSRKKGPSGPETGRHPHNRPGVG